MPRRLCRDDCEILEHDLCRLEYAVAKRHPLIDKVGLPECSELPPVGTKDSYNCFSIGIPKQSEVIEGESFLVKCSKMLIIDHPFALVYFFWVFLQLIWHLVLTK